MQNQLLVKFTIPPAWRMIDEVRGRIAADTVIKNDAELLDATTMACSELLENAVKYGYHEPDAEPVTLQLRVTDDELRIEVRNGLGDPGDLERLVEIVDRLRDGDPAELYNQRLIEIAMNPETDSGRLGLFRIAYEGGFRLARRTEGRSVIIIAIREL